ncbi:MAG: hypothetical protein OXH67_14390 [Acidimicrobiaceae bacterium]|nr:hypothetical protein [Acidimicrobiaceae bacterium]
MAADPEVERRESTRIHLLWKGPHTFGDVLQMDGGTDFGIYQVYGSHPVSGEDSLLYIGQANDQTFGARFTNPDRQLWSRDDAWGDNTSLLRFFTGRVHPTQSEQDRSAVDDELWGTYIDMAEKLLICAHVPHWNAQGVHGITPEKTNVYDNCHVLNWGTRASLLPEVSGLRHAWTEFERISDDPLEWTAGQAG